MQRRDESGQPVKGQRGNAIRPKARKASTAQVSTADLQEQLDRAKRERDEALEQQTATSEVLQTISSSPGKLDPVFQAILANATRLCGAEFAILFRVNEGLALPLATFGVPQPIMELVHRRGEFRPNENAPIMRAAKTKQVVHVVDYRKEQAYIERDAFVVIGVEVVGIRTLLIVPMLKDGQFIGTINIFRKDVRPFTHKQIELVSNFASQAVIAIENTRLLNELRESLQQQTATADVLKVISSSPGTLDPVFGTMLAKASELCEASYGTLWLREGDGLRAAAMHGDLPPAWFEQWRSGAIYRPRQGVPLARVTEERQPIQVADMRTDPSYLQGDPLPVAGVEIAGIRTLLVVPMFKEDAFVGAIAIYRKEVLPFTEKQIELVKNFAAQAVIAIENTRLLNELRQRTGDLSEALEQQTATSEVLSVISSSPGELEPVFKAMLENATRLCEARIGTMWLREGDAFRAASLHGPLPPAFIDLLRSGTLFRPGPDTPTGRVTQTRQPVQVLDLRETRAYLDHRDPVTVAGVEVAGIRTMFSVPMLKEDQLVGTISIFRQEMLPFTDKQIELVQNFAAQAVIAIENTRLLNELRQRTDDLTEALEQQTATSEVLKVISSSPAELRPVFETMLENAVRICGAKFGNLWLREGDNFRIGATYGAPPAFRDYLRREPVLHPDPKLGLGRMIRTKEPYQTADIAATPPLDDKVRVATINLAGARTSIGVPMLKDNEVIGAIAVYRQEVRPFTDKQIELVQNFAAQAVIAIENTRLLNELRESLQQQTATADVLKVISSSPGDLKPVFETMLANAVRICEAKFGSLFRFDGENFHFATEVGTPQRYAEFERARGPFQPRQGTQLERIMLTKQLCHTNDYTAEAVVGHAATLGGARSLIGVPMLKDDALIGVILIYRQEVRPFTDKQVELVKNFAAQAVIAIENTRLLSELREFLQQQTATADVLKVISRSTFDLQTVLNTLTESACRLCDAEASTIWRPEGDVYKVAALFGQSTKHQQAIRQLSIRPGRDTCTGRVLIERQTVHIPDCEADPEYSAAGVLRVAGNRAMLGIPLLREGTPIGVLVLTRSTARPFTDKQIELATTFADQAVIAIENVRLFDEVQARTRDLSESLQQQTATADVLKVISRSTFDLRTVLQTLVKSAARFCDADKATIIREKDGAFYSAEAYGFSREFMDYIKNIPIEAERGSASGRALLDGRVVHIPDVQADPEYTLADAQRLGDYRTTLSVPMLREGVPIGVLTLTRSEVRPFTDKQIELVTTFADQAAIAIENVRLFESVEARTRELAKSLEDLRSAQDRLVQTEKLASLGQLTAGIAHEIKNPLNFVNNFSGVSAELIDELQDALSGISIDHKARAEIKELTDTLRGNLDKVVQHGKRADAIVKNMLLHSRAGSGEHRPVDINAVVEESLNLAWHGARAEKQGFNITLQRSLDPAAGEVDVFPQDITRVLLNLISNGFYAATKRKTEANGGDYEPTLTAATKNLGDRVEIRIRDNGAGIPPEVKEKIFNPFFTTKPAGEGTGLGLSISHDIIVKQHGGSIEVDTQPGEFTELRIILPRAAVFLAEPGRRA